MRGYEYPRQLILILTKMLFLPMRGYESPAPVYLKRIIIVISPHEGL